MLLHDKDDPKNYITLGEVVEVEQRGSGSEQERLLLWEWAHAQCANHVVRLHRTCGETSMGIKVGGSAGQVLG